MGHWFDVAPCALLCQARPQRVAVVAAVGQRMSAFAETGDMSAALRPS